MVVLGQFTVSIVAARLFFASLIRDTFRVRMDGGGLSIADLMQAKTRSSYDKQPIKPWKLVNLPGLSKQGANRITSAIVNMNVN
jgi:hypothetical protein